MYCLILTAEGRVVFCYYRGSLLAYQAAQVKVCKMCVSVHIFQKAFCPVIFWQMIGVWPNFYDGLPPTTACLMQNDNSQIPILYSANTPTCAGVRPSSPYYRVRIHFMETFQQNVTMFQNEVVRCIPDPAR